MQVYRVSPILKYSPFYKLTYFSKINFSVGDICEIDFNKRKIYALVVEVLSLHDARVEIRQGSFKTKKIEKKLDVEIEKFLGEEGFGWLHKFACKFVQPTGEVFFAMFGEPNNFPKVNNNFKILESLNIFPDKLSFFGKENILSGTAIFEYLEQVRKNGNLKQIKTIIINEFSLEKYIGYQTPNIAYVDLLFLYLKIFQDNFKPKIIFQTDYLGISEKYFIDNLKLQKEIVLDKNQAKKYIYNILDNQKVIDEYLLEKIKLKKTFIFVLVNFYESAIFCKDCKSPYQCEVCNENFSILCEEDENGQDRFLFCKGCLNKKILKQDQYLICKNCGGWALFPSGTGAQRIYAELLQNNFKKEEVEFIDESQKKLSEKKLTETVKNFIKNDKKILLGTIRTQKVLKNILEEKKERVQTVVLSLGAILSGKSFESSEKFIRILASLEAISSVMYIAKAGKEKDILEEFKDKENFLENELNLRKIFQLPPFKKVLSFTFNFRNKKNVDKYLEKFFANLALQTKKRNNIYYHFLFSETEILENATHFENLRLFGQFIVSNHIYENFLQKRN